MGLLSGVCGYTGGCRFSSAYVFYHLVVSAQAGVELEMVDVDVVLEAEEGCWDGVIF